MGAETESADLSFLPSSLSIVEEYRTVQWEEVGDCCKVLLREENESFCPFPPSVTPKGK